MYMFCYQCQETGEGSGCRWVGACGKPDDTANYLDLLIFGLKGLAACLTRLRPALILPDRDTELFVANALFATVTNVCFDPDRMLGLAREAHERKARLLHEHGALLGENGPEAMRWLPTDEDDLRAKALKVGVLFSNPDEDERSLKETVVYGLKGIAAYLFHAMILGHDDPEQSAFILDALNATLEPKTLDELLALALETGRWTIRSMAHLEMANTQTYGQPQITSVPLGVRANPAILITGHDLKDLDELLEQTEGTGVDVYTHSEMIPAHYYPAFNRHAQLAGNYGNAWWNQDRDFATFNGPILVTSNCITPVQDSYRERIFTTGPAAYPGVAHIAADPVTGRKDFFPLIELARHCPPPTPIDEGVFVGGFGHQVLESVTGRLLELVRSGAIRHIVVIAGCDGRDPARDYYRQVAERLPHDTVILTAGCAKYRFMQVHAGEIEGIPRIIDAGQCNDCYSLVAIALKLVELTGSADLNALPISFDIPWYDQKSVAVLLALLYLGVRRIRLGPTLPAFLSPRVRALLAERYDIRTIGTPADDIAGMLAGN
jgi:hydroxylamine reductase